MQKQKQFFMKTDKLLYLLLLLLINSNVAIAQKDPDFYNKLFAASDSIHASRLIFSTDSAVLAKAHALDQKHPVEFFNTSASLLSNYTFNEAAFIFYLGVLRYRYYNSANPHYQASDDGALLSSLQAQLGEPINLFLKANVDNFINVLKLTLAYYKVNDYPFFPKAKNLSKYDSVANAFSKNIKDLEENKASYTKEWNAEYEQTKKSQ